MNMNEPPSLLRNDVSGDGHWLKVLLVGVKSNRSAIGARVTARYGGRTQAQEVMAQSSFYSANDRRLHFGLGTATVADLTIRWPNGATEQIAAVAADQLVVIREGFGHAPDPEVRLSPRVGPGNAGDAREPSTYSTPPRSCRNATVLPWSPREDASGNRRAYPSGVHSTTSSGRS